MQEQGIPADQVRPLPVATYSVPEFNEQGRETGRTVKVVTTQRFEVQSTDVKKVEQLALGVAALVEQGVLVEPETPEYHYSGLSELKVEVQALAAQDAIERARRIAAARRQARRHPQRPHGRAARSRRATRTWFPITASTTFPRSRRRSPPSSPHRSRCGRRRPRGSIIMEP